MIIYIHGFGSNALGYKARAFREFFKQKGDRFIALSLSHIPELAIQTLEDLIESYTDEKVVLMGSSLGGFYATYLAQKYDLKAVLINPAVNAHVTLKKAVPQAINYYDDSHFEWRENYLVMLHKYLVNVEKQENILLMLQQGDDVLDYQEALERFPDANLILEEGGSHNFDGIERHFEKVREFLLA